MAIPRVAAIAALALLAAALGPTFTTGAAAQAPPAALRVRGTIVSVAADTLVVRDRSGEVVALALPDKLVVSEVFPIALQDIRPGSYIGTAAMPQADGTSRAIAVTVFPESARGLGDGHRPFDLQPGSTMTNGTVTDVAGVAEAAASGRKLVLQYKDGQQTIVVPAAAPIVSSKPADRSLLVPGASVSVFAQLMDGKPTALRINAGRGGFQLPY